jgi:hypothetical protein
VAVTYYTWNGQDGDEPTLHVYSYGLMNIWDDGLTSDQHWLDRDPPTLKKEVLENLEAWGGEWRPGSLEIHFPNGNDHGAMLWKMTYPSKTGCTSPSKHHFDEYEDLLNSRIKTRILKGSGIE